MFGWYSFLMEHKELFASFLVTLIGIVKLSTWGRAQAVALDTIVGVVERLGADNVKEAVSRKESSLAPAAKDALKDAVYTADPKKPTPSVLGTIFREIFRFGK